MFEIDEDYNIIVQEDLTDDEKMDALHLLIDKLSPEFKELGDIYAHKSFHRVEIIRVDLTTFSGKRKKLKKAPVY